MNLSFTYMTRSETDALFDKIDKLGDGSIDYDEFSEYIADNPETAVFWEYIRSSSMFRYQRGEDY